MVIENRLKSIRMREYEMTQKEFANLLGIKASTYNLIESSRRMPSIEMAFSVAETLNKKVDDIWYSN